jgi:hypothetical protein
MYVVAPAGISEASIAELVHAAPLLRRNLPAIPGAANPVPPRATARTPEVIFVAFKFVRPEPFAVNEPVNNALPTTCSFSLGAVVPIPTFVFAVAPLIPEMLPSTSELLAVTLAL